MNNKFRKKSRLESDDFWMGVAFFVAVNSQNRHQQGAILIDTYGNPIAVSHNGFVQNSNVAESTHFPSAEINALLTVKSSARDGTLYLTHTPCYQSVLMIIAACVKRLVYFSTKKMDANSLEALQSACVEDEEFSGNLNWMRDYMKTLDMLGVFSGNQKK